MNLPMRSLASKCVSVTRFSMYRKLKAQPQKKGGREREREDQLLIGHIIDISSKRERERERERERRRGRWDTFSWKERGGH